MRIHKVQHYYDRNTPLFLAFGSSKSTRSIHRALWPLGIRKLAAALDVSNELIYREILAFIENYPVSKLWLMDLGCGVGDTIWYNLKRLALPVHAVGITISSVQARLAEQMVNSRGIQGSISIIQGDFQALPASGKFHVIYSVEAFVHATDPDAFLSESARNLAPGGILILIDDFRSDDCLDLTTRQEKLIRIYQNGWFVNKLQIPSSVIQCAHELGLGLLKNDNLTRWLRLRTFPDVVLLPLLQLANIFSFSHPIFSSMMGSIALQECLASGIVQYRMLVLQRAEN